MDEAGNKKVADKQPSASETKPIESNKSRRFLIGGAILLAAIVIVLGLWLVVSNFSPRPQTSVAPSPANKQSWQQVPQPEASKEDAYLGNITQKLKLSTIKLTGLGSQGLDIDPQTGIVYIGSFSGLTNKCTRGDSNRGDSYLNVVDPAQGKEIAATVADPSPIWPAVNTQRGLVYLASSTGVVGVFKLGTGQRDGVFNVGGLPHQPGMLGNILVVSNTYDSSQTYYSAVDLDTKKVLGAHKGPRLPHPIIVDAEQKIAYMMGVEDGDMQVIDMTTGKPKERFTLSGGVGQMIIAKKHNLLITDSAQPGTSVAFFDLTTRQPLAKIGFQDVSTPGTGLAVDEENGLVFVVIADHNAIGVASLKTMEPLGRFNVGPCPYAVRLDVPRGKGYITNTGDGTLTVLDLKSLRSALGK